MQSALDPSENRTDVLQNRLVRKKKTPIKLVLFDRLSVTASQLALNLASFKCLLISLSDYFPFIRITHLSAKRHNWEVRRSHRNRNKFWKLKNYLGCSPVGIECCLVRRLGRSTISVSRNQQNDLCGFMSVAGHCQSLFSPVFCCHFSICHWLLFFFF